MVHLCLSGKGAHYSELLVSDLTKLCSCALGVGGSAQIWYRRLHVTLYDFIGESNVKYDPFCHVSEKSLSLWFPRFLHV